MNAYLMHVTTTIYRIQEYSYVQYWIIVERKPKFYLFHLGFPIVLFLTIGITTFLVPVDSGEKVTSHIMQIDITIV